MVKYSRLFSRNPYRADIFTLTLNCFRKYFYFIKGRRPAGTRKSRPHPLLCRVVSNVSGCIQNIKKLFPFQISPQLFQSTVPSNVNITSNDKQCTIHYIKCAADCRVFSNRWHEFSCDKFLGVPKFSVTFVFPFPLKIWSFSLVLCLNPVKKQNNSFHFFPATIAFQSCCNWRCMLLPGSDSRVCRCANLFISNDSAQQTSLSYTAQKARATSLHLFLLLFRDLSSRLLQTTRRLLSFFM